MIQQYVLLVVVRECVKRERAGVVAGGNAVKKGEGEWRQVLSRLPPCCFKTTFLLRPASTHACAACSICNRPLRQLSMPELQ